MPTEQTCTEDADLQARIYTKRAIRFRIENYSVRSVWEGQMRASPCRARAYLCHLVERQRLPPSLWVQQ